MVCQARLLYDLLTNRLKVSEGSSDFVAYLKQRGPGGAPDHALGTYILLPYCVALTSGRAGEPEERNDINAGSVKAGHCNRAEDWIVS